MEEYLRRVQSRLGAGLPGGPVHAVLGGPEPDVDTVAATLCLALHLSQMQPSGGVCVPLLCRKRCSKELPEETVRYLQRVKISESLLFWREDVDLMNLHQAGKLLLSLLRDGVLESSEYHTLESSILRVVHQDGQRDAVDDGALSALTTVAREILQEAAEQSRAPLRELLRDALPLLKEALWIKRGHGPEELEDVLRSLEQWDDATVNLPDKVKQKELMQLLMMELKEITDGEMTLAITSLTTDKEDWHEYRDDLKLLCHQNDYDGLVVVLSINDTVHHPRQQVAVYSSNTDILNQVCAELEVSCRWSFSGELEEKEDLQVYHIPVSTSASSSTLPLLLQDIRGILKDFVNQHSSVLGCHPSSRTSSTEGVAGSVEFSQGSSGINDMDGSDTERADGGNGDVAAEARTTAEVKDETGTVGVCAGGEQLSPDSGMTTIRSSRSSKESSVFLSDDSPGGEGPPGGPGVLFLRNSSPLGFSSLSPPVPPERRKHRSGKSKTDNFSFDPLHSRDQRLPAEGELVDALEGIYEGERRAGSSSLSELDEMSLLDFSAPNSIGGLESRNSSIDHHGQMYANDMMDTMIPPTPVNSLVGSRPPSSCGVRFFPEDVVERINGLQHKDSVSSSLSETWDDLSSETQGTVSSTDISALNKLRNSGSPQTVVSEVKDLAGYMSERDSGDQISKLDAAHQRVKTLEPQLSLSTEPTETSETWNPDYVFKDQWEPATLADLHLTPPEDRVSLKSKAAITVEKQTTHSALGKKPIPNTLTLKEDEVKRRDQHTEHLDFWTYSAQKGFLKSDSRITTSYPESLDMWNMTIRDDSISPLTTPDNLSESLASFCGRNTIMEKDTSLESPLGYSDGGMAMWNTTIQEESSSATTTPEGPEHEKDLRCGRSLVSNDSAETEEKCDPTPQDHWRGVEHNVKIVIETADRESQGEEIDGNPMQGFQNESSETGNENLVSIYSDFEPLPHGSTDLWGLPVQGMVTSTSEYDNVGDGGFSLASTPGDSASPVVDLIQIEEQSSPFIAIPRHVQKQHQTAEPLGETQADPDRDQMANHVFVFDKELADLTGSKESPVKYKSKMIGSDNLDDFDWTDQSSDYSPFLLVDNSTASLEVSEIQREDSEIQVKTHKSLSLMYMGGDYPSPNRYDDSSSSIDLDSKMGNTVEDRSRAKNQDLEQKENDSNVGDKIAQGTYLSCHSTEERETPSSPNKLQSGHKINNECSSDSTVQIGYVVMPGTKKETNCESSDSITQDNKPSKGKHKPMETFSMLSYAVAALGSRAKTAYDEHLDISQQTCQQHTRGAETKTAPSEITKPFQSNLDNTADNHLLPGISISDQLQNSYEALQKSNFETAKEESPENMSGSVARSMSPSLRYPSDHFLKTREEVYVHSQISMEDSDEGEHSPPAPPPSAASLADLKLWGGQLVCRDVPEATSEAQSPALTNSSVSQSSSPICSPLNELCFSTEKQLGLPFSGDLMEEEHEDDDTECSGLPNSSNKEQAERREKQEFKPPDLLSFTEELIETPMFQQTHLNYIEPKSAELPFKREDYYDSQPVRTDGNQLTVQEASGDLLSHVLSNRKPQDEMSQLSSQPTNENAASEWTGSLNTTQGQSKYGYNYHHIDQRTENQCSHPPCMDAKPECQQSASDVYAEFTTSAQTEYLRPKQSQHLDHAHLNYQYFTDNTYVEEPMSTSEFQYSQHEAAGHSAEGYVHVLLSRNSQQGEDDAAMMKKINPNEEAAEEQENREDPSSSADTSAGSNQRRKLSAPPLNLSLEHSEGSLLSEDALDTDDDTLDTGDDLDVDGMETPDEADSLEIYIHESEETGLGAEAAAGEGAAKHRAEEKGDGRLWRSVVIGEQEHRIDMKCIQPYKRVISHGGYYAEKNAIIVFAACFLPDSDCDNYNYVMENLFLYVISTLELMVAEDYMIVYLNGATPRRRMPGFSWMKRCYQMIDRRLKKNLKMFIIVHPSWFIRTLLGLTRPFISSKFSSKIKYVHSLQELGEIIPMEYVHIPPSIMKVDKGKSTV
ncbi:uncharacterized protein LOC119797393 isoform X1 [Cyprinodon tularosa]|uniref:uncharacterized protein LOC119797393 isoform X1 n=2 Tax=Cyprinodon tularosa TaxID=77115 RepID=UPI0018E2115E|nr:uncharacterized protein LOC119797393 isoform X1 [Cyprinodon tularosa]